MAKASSKLTTKAKLDTATTIGATTMVVIGVVAVSVALSAVISASVLSIRGGTAYFIGLGSAVNSGLNYSYTTGYPTPTPSPALQAKFIRGDANNDQRVDIGDTTTIVGYLKCLEDADNCKQYPNSLRCKVEQGYLCTVACHDAYDANDDGAIDLRDSNYVAAFQLYGGPKPPMPYPFAGIDPITDSLGCSLSGY